VRQFLEIAGERILRKLAASAAGFRHPAVDFRFRFRVVEMHAHPPPTYDT
jgi:hypothetical protein